MVEGIESLLVYSVLGYRQDFFEVYLPPALGQQKVYASLKWEVVALAYSRLEECE